jgi:outer membrane protein OmpA-like peptidoglycan-associated protein
VEGHTDSVGTADYNMKLSERRAQSVVQFAESLGVKASRFTAKGYGFTQLVATNSTPEGRQQTRRVEVGIMANDDLKRATERNEVKAR